MTKKFIGKADFIIIAIIIIISVAFILFSKLSGGNKVVAEVSQNGEIVKTIDLSAVSEPYEITLDKAVILVEENGISFESAECPDKLCVKCGVLSKKGDIAVCIPTKTVIRIVGSDKSEIDAISY